MKPESLNVAAIFSEFVEEGHQSKPSAVEETLLNELRPVINISLASNRPAEDLMQFLDRKGVWGNVKDQTKLRKAQGWLTVVRAEMKLPELPKGARAVDPGYQEGYRRWIAVNSIPTYEQLLAGWIWHSADYSGINFLSRKSAFAPTVPKSANKAKANQTSRSACAAAPDKASPVSGSMEVSKPSNSTGSAAQGANASQATPDKSLSDAAKRREFLVRTTAGLRRDSENNIITSEEGIDKVRL